jgi:hypothetical protein
MSFAGAVTVLTPDDPDVQTMEYDDGTVEFCTENPPEEDFGSKSGSTSRERKPPLNQRFLVRGGIWWTLGDLNS